ncbi:hypothetical protein [Oceanicaulis sp.]|uniref:hypothetical protein n=1 Tax=Oceanicaulis sp. TaxID=1924941 RepID=UPI003D2A9E30
MTDMTDAEFKQAEGQRILAGLGAIAALPGAGLVTGTGAGAPLFAAALCCVALAYLFWLYTDGVYALSVKLKQAGVLSAWMGRLLRPGRPFQVITLLSAVANVLLTLCGFAGERAGIALPISAQTGFALALGWAGVCAVLALWGYVAMERLRAEVRAHMANAPQD